MPGVTNIEQALPDLTPVCALGWGRLVRLLLSAVCCKDANELTWWGFHASNSWTIWRYIITILLAFSCKEILYVFLTTGSPNDLLKELRSLVDLLVHLEPSIVRTLTEKPQVMDELTIKMYVPLTLVSCCIIQRSITKYLKNLQVCDSESKLLSAIPDGVLLEHYVSLRLFLRK